MLLTEEKKQELLAKWVRVPSVDDTCIWCNACVAIASEVFTMDDEEWKSEVLDLDSYEDLSVDDAISACPVWCISWAE